MSFDEFEHRFRFALAAATQRAGIDSTSLDLAKSQARFHGAGASTRLVPTDQVPTLLFLNEQEFFRIIDVGVLEATNSEVTFFIGVSGHVPTTPHKIWDPTGIRPFKVIEPSK